MKTRLSHMQGILLLSASLLAPTAVLAAQTAPEALLKGATLLAPTEERNTMASDAAVEDTLKACLGRIPLDASAGQRLLAEQSCAGEQATRHQVPSAPTF